MDRKKISAESQADFQKHELLLEVMRIFNTCSDRENMISIMARAVQRHTGIEAVAMRISHNNDYPYITSSGFSADFIESESSLSSSAHSDTTDPFRNTCMHECICGIVLDGVKYPGLSCFSGKGSFRVNSSDDPEISTLANSCDRKFRLKCISEGYNSIALIPLRTDTGTLGLLQLCDTRKDVFSDDLLLFFESCCEILSLALRRRHNEYSTIKTNLDLENIIEQRTTELLKTISEKERLIDEVNHRIRNNLLIITSLLNLQIMKESDSSIRNALNGALDRINSIGVIHHRLYSSHDLENIDFRDYVLILHKRILSTYGIDPGRVKFSFDSSGITTNIDTAIPCGLIFNEILTNSIRHALTPDKELCISASVIHEDDLYKIEISDNGPGIRDDFDPASDGNLGMELIRVLIKQLDGTFELQNKNGLVWKIFLTQEKKEVNRWKQKIS